MSDSESESHAQGCVLTQKKPALRRDVYVENKLYMAFSIDNCVVTNQGGYYTKRGVSITGVCVRIKIWMCTYKSFTILRPYGLG